VSKWDCDSFHSPHLHFHIQLCYEVGVHILLFYQFCDQMRLWLIPLISLHCSVKLFYQVGVQMRLWLISLTTLYFSVKQFYQFCVQMRLWLIPFISLHLYSWMWKCRYGELNESQSHLDTKLIKLFHTKV
jgi:hypothetical protein